MTPFQKRLTPITKRMAEDMLLRNMSLRTIDSYTYHVDRFAKHFGKQPEDLGPEEIREFQLWMIQVNKSSWSQFNQAVCGLRFLYSITLSRPWVVQSVPYGKRAKSLPTVLGQEEVNRLIACVDHLKHRAVLLTLYSAGLRLTEATNLKAQHIDSERMQIKVVKGKGNRDRFVPLSPRLLQVLREYWKANKPTDFLFPGKTPDVPLHGATIQICCKMATAKAHINKHVTPHTLRHSFATGLLEAGVDLMAISKLLGHSSFTTTMIYLHCRRQHLDSIPSPLDWYIHALVPGSGPSIDGKSWIPCRMTKGTIHEPPKPFLVDNKRLGWQFRDAFIAGVERLQKAGKLKVVDSVLLKATLNALKVIDWVVFIEGPPTPDSKAEHVLKYLARYITGGPIANSRLIANEAGHVSFWARSTDKSKKGERVKVSYSGVEFVRCWTLHILPKGFTRSRFYGGWSNTRRKDYSATCDELSPKPTQAQAKNSEPAANDPHVEPQATAKKCPQCECAMELERATHRPSWRELFYGEHQPAWWGIDGSG